MVVSELTFSQCTSWTSLLYHGIIFVCKALTESVAVWFAISNTSVSISLPL